MSTANTPAANSAAADAAATTDAAASSTSLNFLEAIVEADRQEGGRIFGHQVVTRFPPEPNGYLHIGHAKSICLNFGLARDYQGRCHLRFDDTNPMKESVEYVESIQRDVKWLGFDWNTHLYYASDRFEKLYGFAEELIQRGKAYVCHLTAEEIQEYRGNFTTPGRNSPYRDRSVEENLDLFRKMRAGEFTEGTCVLRAKIDMAASNQNLRDPLLYRIRHVEHHNTGDKWCIYPLYDFAHGYCDYLEGITHSICSLEFENHRALYDWFLDALDIKEPRPHQIEFARLKLTYTVMSKRKLLQLVNEKHVDGWDDPRMSTLSGFRRRGYTPASIRNFCNTIGVTRTDSWIDFGVLENAARDDLNANATRALAVLRPIKVVISNYPADQVEHVGVPNHPLKPELGTRLVKFSREVYIEQDDFAEVPPKGYHRLSPGKEVRLRSAYIIRCDSVEKDANGNIVALHCTYDPDTRSGTGTSTRKVKGTIHWVDASAPKATVRLYDRLFNHVYPGEDADFLTQINPQSLEVLTDARIEEGLLGSFNPDAGDAQPHYQFERTGYFFVDPKDSKVGAPVFNRTVTLKDSWAKEQSK